jgi:hypothetical protein
MKRKIARFGISAVALWMPLTAAVAAPVSRYGETFINTGSVTGTILAIFGTAFFLSCR